MEKVLPYLGIAVAVAVGVALAPYVLGFVAVLSVIAIAALLIALAMRTVLPLLPFLAATALCAATLAFSWAVSTLALGAIFHRTSPPSDAAIGTLVVLIFAGMVTNRPASRILRALFARTSRAVTGPSADA